MLYRETCFTALYIRIAREKLRERFSACALFPAQREPINTTRPVLLKSRICCQYEQKKA